MENKNKHVKRDSWKTRINMLKGTVAKKETGVCLEPLTQQCKLSNGYKKMHLKVQKMEPVFQRTNFQKGAIRQVYCMF